MAQDIGIQLYTLRDDLGRDFSGTLDALQELGLHNLELAGQYGGLDGQGLRAALDARDMQARSAHLPLQLLEDDTAGQAAFLQALGARHAVYPYHQADTEEAWTELAQRLERLARALAEHGITLSYHNHGHELSQTFSGRPVLDLLAEQAPSLKLELDVAWIHAGGQDPVAYLQRYADRTPLVHIKDVSRDGDGWRTVELGKGEVDLQAVFANIPEGALLFYEQDQSDGLSSVRESMDYLNAR